MRAEWDALLQESRTNTIFLTWEWLSAWWKAYGKDKELHIIRVVKDGHTVGLAPFYRKKILKFGFLSFRILALVGDGSNDSDYLDWISRDGEEEAVNRSVVEYLLQCRRDWDLIFLNEIPENSPHLAFLRHLSSRNGWHCEETEVPCAYVNLPLEWETYLLSLKPRMRTKIRSLPKQLEQNYKVRFDICSRFDDLKPRLESLFGLHEQRWRQEGKEGVFVSQAKRLFYQEISSLFLSRGWLRFYSLSVDDRYVAHQFCFEYRNIMFLLQEGYDPKLADSGVGNVLRAYVIRDCVERKLAVYDFLGGVTPHKLSWGSNVKKSLRVSVGIPKVKNRIFFGIPKAIAWGKKELKIILPETLVEWGISLKRRIIFKKKGRLIPDAENE
jgi:CelD/BcsL family acetyltransferase involved in cellulose biosynthesis